MQVRPDRVTGAERNLLSPQNGEVIFNTDTGENEYWNGSIWKVSGGSEDYTALKGVQGWGHYQDDRSSPDPVFNTTPTKLTINGLNANGSTDFLPLEIRGSDELWDVVNNKMTPINIGDSYTTRIDFKVEIESGNPTDIILAVDIGGLATPSIVIVEKHISAGKAVPYSIAIATPMYVGQLFKDNGASLFISVDSGTITVGDRAVFISRLSSGNIV